MNNAVLVTDSTQWPTLSETVPLIEAPSRSKCLYFTRGQHNGIIP